MLAAIAASGRGEVLSAASGDGSLSRSKKVLKRERVNQVHRLVDEHLLALHLA